MKSNISRLSFTLALAVVASAAVAVAVAQDLKGDQAAAIGSLRSINTAEVYYASQYKKGWSPALASLGESQEGAKPSASAANLLDNSLTGGQKNNYVFTYKAGKKDATGKIGTYTVSARPVQWHEGLWSLFTDDSGIIRGTSENRPATASDPPLR